jgi:serine/threonine-protein phosphatase PGAM5
LVRHGQYEHSERGTLTALGREQATITGRWLQTHVGERGVDALYSSTLPRARETASIIASEVAHSKVRPASVLREGIYTKLKGFEIPAEERLADRTRADAAYARFFRTSKTDRLEVVVCHGNLIRYLVCRATDVPVARWVRMNSNHCGVTRILVRDTGAVRVVSYNETAHLPPPAVT